jgi:hypothetical protein
MKLTGKTKNGINFTENFDSPNDFLAMQQSDFEAFDDEIQVVELLINEEKIDFVGNFGELYNFLMK